MHKTKLHLTPKEKAEITISRHAIIVIGAKLGLSIFQVRIVFEQYKIPYSYNSMRTTYYRALKGVFPSPIEKYGLINIQKVVRMYESVYPQIKNWPEKNNVLEKNS